MADVTITYQGSDIVELSDSGTKTLKTGGKYCSDDITLEYTKPSGGGGITPTGTKQISITQNGTTTEDVTNYASAEITVNVSGGSSVVEFETLSLNPGSTTGAWSGSTSGKQIINAKAPSSAVYCYPGFTALTPKASIGDTIVCTVTVTSEDHPSKLTAYLNSNHGSMSLGAVNYSSANNGFVYTVTNNTTPKMFSGMYLCDNSSSPYKTWSATVSISINGVTVF